MDGLFSRYRNLSALLLLVAGQLILLAWQIKSNGDTRLIRVWAVTAVTPMARGMETARDATNGFVSRWFMAGALERDNAQFGASCRRAAFRRGCSAAHPAFKPASLSSIAAPWTVSSAEWR